MSDAIPLTETRSVSEIGLAIKRSMHALGSGVVEAEIRKINVANSGHWYIDLADEHSVIGAVVWSSVARGIDAPPKQGDLVQAQYDKIDFYPPHGKVQLHLTSLSPTGEGELLRRRQETINRLKDEGLTDPARKPPLPRFPRRVGLIAGQDSDAAKDVITALRRRFAPVPITFCPALVQGVAAPASLMAAIATLNQTQAVDVIIVARGGGSVSDLAAFDDEALCRAIFASPVPVITSIGHTKDHPVCDYVSAAFAEVPARSAELAIAASSEEALAEIGRAEDSLSAVRRRFDEAKARVSDCENRMSVTAIYGRFTERLSNSRTTLQSTERRLGSLTTDYARAFDRLAGESKSAATRNLKLRAERLNASSSLMSERAHNIFKARRNQIAHQLELLAAADISARGAIFATDDAGQLIRSVDALSEGDQVDLTFVDGSASTTVTNKTKESQ